MTRMTASIIGLLGLTGAALAADPDAAMDRYFSIWSHDAQITPAMVDRVYAHRVSYYGHAMTPQQVLHDKLAYIRAWPHRRYNVIPGSVSKTCNGAMSACTVSAMLAWEKAAGNERHGASGTNSITLSLVREGGTLKIARESGTPVVQSACGRTNAGWRCSPYR